MDYEKCIEETLNNLYWLEDLTGYEEPAISNCIDYLQNLGDVK